MPICRRASAFRTLSTWVSDPAHSEVDFVVTHLEHFKGAMGDLAGSAATLRCDAADVSKLFGDSDDGQGTVDTKQRGPE